MTRLELARRIDHTLLKPEATRDQIDAVCDAALAHRFAAVCVNPMWIAHCADRLAHDDDVQVATVVGFPLGASDTAVKAYETLTAIEAGAREIDMVAPLGALIAGDTAYVTKDISGVVETAQATREGVVVKVILETAALTDEQIRLGCAAAREAGADYVKTSTGFHPAGGATVAHVRLLKEHAAPLKVKAAGGIRDLAAALALRDAGADRLGMSASVDVVQSVAE
jgi:deoxyribose-phosphate aldolase